MINLHADYTGNSNVPDGNYPFGSARNVAVTGDNTGTPFVAALQNDIIGFQQFLLNEAGVVPNGNSDNAITSQQFESIWQIMNMRTLTHNMTVDADYTLTTTENLKTRIVITDTNPFLTTTRNIIIDGVARRLIIKNSTLQALTIKTVAGVGQTVSSGSSTELYCDGVNIENLSSFDINSLDTKAGIVDDDEFAIADSTSSFSLKKLTFANLKAYFDTLYSRTSDIFGIGQTWQDAELTDTGALFLDGTPKYRASGATYTNNTGKPISLSIKCNNDFVVYVGGVGISEANTGQSVSVVTCSVIVPNTSTYRLTTSFGLLTWFELR